MRLRVASARDADVVAVLTGVVPVPGTHVVLAEDRDGAAGTMALARDGEIASVAFRAGLADDAVVTVLYDAIEAEAVRSGMDRLRIADPDTGLAAFLARRGWEKSDGAAMERERPGRA